ncbi:hypothetical protein M1O29_02330, partial [Dehalococcoidia bacterium]|nr:hypothetical protein [Dehalococcoidia bacterium]
MIDFVRFRNWFYLITVGVIVVSIVALAAPPRIPWGLEFSSGTSLTIDFVDPDEQIDSDEVQDRLLALGLEKAIVQKTGDNGFFIRTTVVEDDLVPFLEGQFGPVKVLNYDGVTDLAEVITFIDPVPMAALRDAFEGDGVEGFVTREAPGGIFISAQGISRDKVEDALAVIEKDYGATDRTSFDAEGDMALVLDFGPAVVASKDFEQALADIGEGFDFVKSGLNAFTVVSPSVTQGVRDSLASNLQDLFGLARETTFEDGEDLVTFLNSEQKIEENDLRNELNFQGFSHVDAVPVGETSYLLVAENVPEDSQDELLEALRDRFEGVIPEQFNFAEGLAVTLDFGLPAEFDNVEIEVSRLNPRALVASVGDRYFVGAKNVSEEDKTTLISGLEEVFGLIEHSSFDFAKGVAFTLAFVDPVTLDDLIGSLAIIPVRDALSKGVKVRLSGPRTFDLIGILLPRENQEDVLGDVERRIGSLEISRYDAEMDLAIALNFGGEVTLDDLSVEIAQRAPALEVEAIEGASFILWGSEFDQQQLDPLLSELEAIFGGRVRDVSLADPTHMAEVVSFDPPAKLAEVQDVLFKEQVKDVVVLPIGDKGFFIAG